MIEFRIANLAKRLDVHRNTVRNWINQGRLKASKTIAKRYIIHEKDFYDFCIQNAVPLEKIENMFPEGYLDSQLVAAGKGVSSSEPVGSVMVVGGGISGIQSALDLAESGYYVYLVEKSSGIGGVMPQLDKTFPTNDCAM